MDNILTEDETILSLISNLKNNGWTIESHCLGHKRGYDIVAVKNGKKIFVEAKGAKANDKSPIKKRAKFDSGQIKTHLGKAIVKCYDTQLKYPNGLIAIAHPDTEYLRQVIDKYIPFLNKAGITHYWVKKNGIVETSETNLKT